MYGVALLQNLPICNLQIHENKSITESFIDKVLNKHDCSNIGYVLTVDLIYPDNIQDKSKKFPFCPENKIIDPDSFTEYMKENVPKPYRPTSKLVCDQTNNDLYIVQYTYLKFHVRMGLTISKLHRIVSFDQTPWLEKYIDYNTKKRAQADSDFEKDYHESLICSFFGKTMEDVRNRIKLNLLRMRMRRNF